MRVPLAFLGACLMALALFALMLYMVAPPRSQPSDEPVTVASFVRLDGNASDTATRTRQQAPQPPQPQTPQPPTPPTPVAATPSATLPALDLQLPSLSSGIAVNSAPTPSLSGLSAGAAAPSAPAPSDAIAPPRASMPLPGAVSQAARIKGSNRTRRRFMQNSPGRQASCRYGPSGWRRKGAQRD